MYALFFYVLKAKSFFGLRSWLEGSGFGLYNVYAPTLMQDSPLGLLLAH